MIRTRFAPSPTGDLHVGSARTALYCWLYAKHTDGKFILRIEDTDRERSTEAAVNVILDGMKWLGMEPDEGPFYQTQHFDRYKQVIEELLAAGKAYPCTCSKERLDTLREQQIEAKQKPRYDGHCRDRDDIDTSQPHVIRFKNPEQGAVLIQDQILGDITIQNSELDDLIIARTDGTPTYNFTVVVDDMDMQVSHVIRGNDHLNNTPRQINLFNALGATPPLYAHIPMILGDDGKKLSKRHGAVSVLHYREEGYLPQALLNYLVRLGWSHGDQEIFSVDEMIEYFDISQVNKAPSAFNTEKLQWLNQHYMKTLPIEEILVPIQWHCRQLGIDESQGPALTDVIEVQRGRYKTLKELAQASTYFYQEVSEYNAEAAAEHLHTDILPALQHLQQQLSELSAWSIETIKPVIKATLKQFELKMPKLALPVRVAVTGNTASPSLDATLWLIGKERVLARIQRACEFISAH